VTEPPLRIKVLEVTRYSPDGRYTTHSTPGPNWTEVETAIRALDHHQLPFIFIGLREQCRGEDCLSVLGGRNGYAISAADSVGGWLQYCDPMAQGWRDSDLDQRSGFIAELPESHGHRVFSVLVEVEVMRSHFESGDLDQRAVVPGAE